LAAVSLDFAEELVDVGDAVRPPGLARLEPVGAGAHPVPVEVVAVGDVEAEFDPVAAGRHRIKAERLRDRQQLVRIHALGLGGAGEQAGGEGERPQDACGPAQACALPPASLAIHSRYAGNPPPIPTAMTSGTSYGCSSAMRAVSASSCSFVVLASISTSSPLSIAPCQR